MNWLILNQPRYFAKGMKNHKYFFYDTREKGEKKYENEMNYDFKIEKWENLYLSEKWIEGVKGKMSGKSNQRFYIDDDGCDA